MDIHHWDYQRIKDYTLFRIRIYSKAMPSGCIEWQRAKSKQGYGQLNVYFADEGPRSGYVHRLLWELTHDVELGRNICVCHKCDNPSCVNIKHLFVGTRKDNSQDMVRKGRAGNQGKKLSPERVAKMIGVKRKLHTRHRVHDDDKIRAIKQATGGVQEVADKFGVSIGYVSRLRNGKAKTLI